MNLPEALVLCVAIIVFGLVYWKMLDNNTKVSQMNLEAFLKDKK